MPRRVVHAEDLHGAMMGTVDNFLRNVLLSEVDLEDLLDAVDGRIEVLERFAPKDAGSHLAEQLENLRTLKRRFGALLQE